MLEGQSVLVTGATGFIGGRLVEKLFAQPPVRVRALVNNLARCPRIARFPTELVAGGLQSPELLRQACTGIDVLFHCAVGTHGDERDTTVEGTRRIAEAALAAGVRRFVHVSTISVYGPTPAGTMDETTAKRATHEVYAQTKLEAENIVLDMFRSKGLPVVVIQPTIVYGPFGGAWTLNPLNQVKNGRMILPDHGDGICNAVYVDDVVDALLLAASRPSIEGEAFLVSGGTPVSWWDFYDSYQRMAGRASLQSRSSAEIREEHARLTYVPPWKETVVEALRKRPHVRARLRRLPLVRMAVATAKVLVPSSRYRRMREDVYRAPSFDSAARPAPDPDPLIWPYPVLLDLFMLKTTVRIDKARRVLGYSPVFDFERGMAATARWARWARLIS